jgi:hypothetical protein
MSNAYNIAKQGDSLKALERRRKLRLLRWLPTFLWIVSLGLYWNYWSRMGWGHDGEFALIMLNGLVFPLVVLFFSTRRKYKSRYVDEVMPIVAKQVGCGYSKSGRMAGKHFVNAQLYHGRFSRINYEHQFTGEHKGAKFAFATIKILRLSNVTIAGVGPQSFSRGLTSIGLGNVEYSGLRYSIAREQNVRGNVVILPLLENVKDNWDKRVVQNLLAMKQLEDFEYFPTYDSDFDRHFMVFTTQPAAAENLLNEEMKEKLLQTRQDFEVSASFSFRNSHLYIHALQRDA